MNKIKSFFKDRHFSVDGLVDVVVSAAGLAAFAFAIMGLIYVGSKYPVECCATLMGIILLAGIGCVLFGIFDEVFPKIDPELEQWIESAKNESKKINEDDKLNAIHEKKKKLKADIKQAEQDYMEDWIKNIKKGVTPEQMAWLHNWFGDMNKNISEGVLWKKKEIIHESN